MAVFFNYSNFIYKTGDHSSQALEFNHMNFIYSGKKMLALSECGSFPDAEELVADEVKWSWLCPCMVCLPVMLLTTHYLTKGRIVKSIEGNDRKTDIILSDLPRGMYLIKVGSHAVKVIRQ